MRQAWTRLQYPREGAKPYEAFVLYRDMGAERSIEKVREKVRGTGKKTSGQILYRWSARFNWVARAQAYDSHLDEQKRRAAEHELEEMAKRHAKNAQATMNVLMTPVLALVRRVQQDQEVLAKMPVGSLLSIATNTARAMPSLVTVERLARGLSTENLRVEAGDGIAHAVLNDPEAADLASRFLERVATGPGDAGGSGVPGQ